MPWVDSRRFVQWAAPALVGLVFLSGWEILCRAWSVPSYLVPRPSVIAATLIEDRVLLFQSLWATLKITVFAFVLAVVLGSLISFVFVQSRCGRGEVCSPTRSCCRSRRSPRSPP
jgi:NitT/TauT family transport system permease protein